MKIKDTELFFLGKTLLFLSVCKTFAGKKNIINQKKKRLSVCRIIHFLSTLTTSLPYKDTFHVR